MIIKRKQNAKVIFEPKTSKYYLDQIKAMQEFDYMQQVFQKYHEFHKLEKEQEKRFFENGVLKYEFTPEQVFLIAKSVQILKYFVDNSFFFESRETLENTSTDLFYLYEIIYKQYMAYIPEKQKKKIEENNKELQVINF